MQHHEITHLAHTATIALLRQEPVTITHPPGWERNGFPLPIKREKPAEDGSVTQNYRPLAILDHVNELLSTKRHNEPSQEAATTE